MEINENDDVFGTNTTKRDIDVRELELSSNDTGFCKREYDEDQKEEGFNSHTSLAKPYQGIKDGRQRPCTCKTWSS